ncbi:odorant receptor 131-2-like [Sphaeramia orbicularis]|uniref:odorant receptor 131-2-like n=1 Tax=Sphaeramia orbicularis TaxID=375764 RepID=UPI00117E355C|nr:odorant receptor 131-2-like [Sphaeramia orbicularis]
MAYNYSDLDGGFSIPRVDHRITIIQVLVVIFLCINFLQLTTFFMKDFFYRTMHYILFANTLLADCMTLIITNILLILNTFRVAIQMWMCLIVCAISSLYFYITLVTLTAMTLERYVAICMPLRHAELCSTRRALYSILIIYALSSIPFIVIISAVIASATLRYEEYTVCTVEVIIHYNWRLRFGISQFYFLIMCLIIVFSYVKIMKVAKAASGESKTSVTKGLRTVVLHAFQLLLCLTQLWCPLIENAVLQIDIMLFIYIRYFDYIVFILAPRCLSPLIYGLRDEKFVRELKYYALCRLYRKNNNRK